MIKQLCNNRFGSPLPSSSWKAKPKSLGLSYDCVSRWVPATPKAYAGSVGPI